MKYRILLKNTKTGASSFTTDTYTNKKKAITFADEFMRVMENSEVQVYKEVKNVKTRIY